MLTISKYDLIEFVKNIKSGKIRDHFQKRRKHEIKTTKSSTKPVSFADKTSKMYKLTKVE